MITCCADALPRASVAAVASARKNPNFIDASDENDENIVNVFELSGQFSRVLRLLVNRRLVSESANESGAPDPAARSPRAVNRGKAKRTRRHDAGRQIRLNPFSPAAA